MIELINGDCLEEMKKIESGSVDMVYADVLYGTGRNFKDYVDIKSDYETVNAFYTPVFKEIRRLLKGNGCVYIQVGVDITHILRMIMDTVFGQENFKNEIVWAYRNGIKNKKKYPNKHDRIIFYSVGKNYTFNQVRYNLSREDRIKQLRQKIYKDEMGEYFYDNRYQSNGVPKTKRYIDDLMDNSFIQQSDVIIDIDFLNGSSKERCGYATQKPVALLEKLLLTSTNENDTVLDPFMGSGTTGVACKNLNRNFIGIDINSEAVEIAKDRIASVGN